MTNTDQTGSNVAASNSASTSSLINFNISIKITPTSPRLEGLSGKVSLLNTSGNVVGIGYFKTVMNFRDNSEVMFLMNSFAAEVYRYDTYYLKVDLWIKFTYNIQGFLKLGGSQVAEINASTISNFTVNSAKNPISGAAIIDNNDVQILHYNAALPNSVELEFS